MMKTQSPLDNAVALIRYHPHENSLAKALSLWRGLQGISGEVRNKGLFSVKKSLLKKSFLQADQKCPDAS
jgi:hypothetical protein